MVVLVNQLWVSSDPRPYNQKPPAHRREASVASSLSPLILRLSPSFPKKPGRSFVPFFLLPRSNSPRLGLVRNALPAAPVLTILSLSNLQLGPAPTQHLSIILPFPIVLPSSVSPTQSTALTTIICATPLPACRNIGVRGCCRNNWLARNPAKPTSLQTISQSPSTSARDSLKHPHSERSTDWQLNLTFSSSQLRSKAISHIPPPTSHKLEQAGWTTLELRDSARS